MKVSSLFIMRRPSLSRSHSITLAIFLVVSQLLSLKNVIAFAGISQSTSNNASSRYMQSLGLRRNSATQRSVLQRFYDEDTTSNPSFLLTPLTTATSRDNSNIIHQGRQDVSSISSSSSSGGASIPNLTISLVKSIVGGGILALPAGVAALGDTPNVVPLACALIGVVGAIYAYYFTLLGQVCHWTGATSYRQAWERTVGASSSGGSSSSSKNNNDATSNNHNSSGQAVAIVVALKTALSCLAYSMILADSGQYFLSAMAGADVSRIQSLEVVTIFFLLPLCLLKDLSSLAPFSLAGLAGVAFTGASMATRYMDGSYRPGGQYLSDLAEHLQPSFGSTMTASSGGELHWQGIVLACTLATAFVAHYNAPRFHAELVDNSPTRFNLVTVMAFGFSALAFMGIAADGFLTFGTHAQALILNNYSAMDPLIAAARVALSASIVLTFPLPFVGLRDGVLDVWQVPHEERSDNVLLFLSVTLLALITAVAAHVQDLALVLSIGGGTFSTAVASIFPTMMFRAAVDQRKDKADYQGQADLALHLMYVCVGIGATGVALTLAKFL